MQGDSTTLTCGRCYRIKPVGEFNICRGHRSGFQLWCKPCHNEHKRVTHRVARLRPGFYHAVTVARYGITPEQYAALLAKQGGVCAICGLPESVGSPSKKGGVRRLCVDHCHDTGLVRGLLCAECNSAIGKFHDDPTLLRAAIAYLQRHSKRR